MNLRQFEILVKKHFGHVLEPIGFRTERSNHSTFYRQASKEIYHIIMPDLSSDGTWFDIRVFATSSLIEPNFEALFPDELRIPSGMFSLLHPKTGVGADQKQYRCKYEEGFIRNFKKEVIPAIVDKALPYLDLINDLSDLVPLIKSDFYLGATLWHTGEQERARKLLLKEQSRISGISDDTGRVSVVLNYIENILR